MPRAKKDGVHLNCYINRELREKLDAYAEEKGQTITTALERILGQYFDLFCLPTHTILLRENTFLLEKNHTKT